MAGSSSGSMSDTAWIGTVPTMPVAARNPSGIACRVQRGVSAAWVDRLRL